MSWSILRFRKLQADAHDVEQEHFMALAAMYVEADPTYRELGWFREWQAYWLDSVGVMGNGGSEIGLDAHLTDEERVAQFRRFLQSYRAWLLAVARALDLAVRHPEAETLVAFIDVIEAVLDGDETHPRVSRTAADPHP